MVSFGAFQNQQDFVRHVRNMAAIGLILYV